MPNIKVPVSTINNEQWAHLNYFGNHHVVTGEVFKLKRGDFSFLGGHRVRAYLVKSNVHWKIPIGVSLDIEGVEPSTTPQRRLPQH